MSDEANGKEAPLDLSGLDFGPAWAKADAPARDYSKESGPRQTGDRRGKGGGRRDDRRRDDRRDDRRGGGDRPQRGERRDNRDNREHRGRGDDRRGYGPRGERRERAPEVPAPEGFTASIMPVEEGLDNLSKQIQAGGRTYSVFDLAKVVMGARERFNVVFRAPNGQKFFRCKSDGSIWLTREELVSHFWKGGLVNEFYEEIEIEGEAPSGSFNAVAKCGLSGEWLGPPNYHGYQPAIAQLHRERFPHLTLENYKRKIQTVSGEEAVNEWLDSMKKQLRFRPLSDEEIKAKREEKLGQTVPESPAAEAEAAEEPVATENLVVESEEAPAETTETEESPEAVASGEATAAAEAEITEDDSAPAEEDSPQPEPEETAPAAGSTNLIDDRREVERHFLENNFGKLFAEVDRAWVPGNVAGKMLSPGLLTLLKETVAEERRYPGKLTPLLCRQLTGRHLAVFKWRKKLKAGPARPHAIPHDIQLAERPSKILEWVESNSGSKLEDLWKAVLPADCDEEVKRQYYHDLHWVLNQGFVLLMADEESGILTLHLAKGRSEPEAAGAPAETPGSPEASEDPNEAETEAPAETVAEPISEAAEETPSEEPETSVEEVADEKPESEEDANPEN